MNSSELGEIVAGLTKAQRDVFMNGLSGRYTIATLLALKRKGLVRQFVAHPTENAWPDTPLGAAVRQYIEEKG